MAATRQVHISQKVAVPLSLLMAGAAVLAFTHIPNIGGPDPPLFTTTRHPKVSNLSPPLSRSRYKTHPRMLTGVIYFTPPQTGEHILSWRRLTAPPWIYQGLHAAPAILWCVMMPLQHVDRLRRRWPALHRGSGYVVLSGSLLLSATGYWLLAKHMAHTHDNPLHVHSLSGFSPVGWPTFEATLWALGPIYLYSLVKTAATARARDLGGHRRWAVFHTMVAYVISLERLSLLLSYVAGWVLALWPKDEVHQYLGIEDTLEAKAEAERDVFALANVTAFSMVVCWALYEWGSAGYLKGFVNSFAVPIDVHSKEE